MSEKIYPVPAEWAARAHVDDRKYQEMYKHSVADPNGFWGEHGKRVDWIKPYTKVKNTSYAPDNVSIKWYEDGTLNVNGLEAWLRDPASVKAMAPDEGRGMPNLGLSETEIDDLVAFLATTGVPPSPDNIEQSYVD